MRKKFIFSLLTVYIVFIILYSTFKMMEFVDMIHIDALRTKIYQYFSNILLAIIFYIIVSIVHVFKNEKTN